MDITKINEAKVLIDNYIRLQEIESRLHEGGDLLATHHDRDDDETDGPDYISKIRVYIPAPLRASFLASTRQMLKLEANKIAEL